MTFHVQKHDEQNNLLRQTVKRLLKKEHGLENLIYDPLDGSWNYAFEDYYLELHELGLC